MYIYVYTCVYIIYIKMKYQYTISDTVFLEETESLTLPDIAN